MKLRKILIFVLFMFALVFALNLSVNVKAAGEQTITINYNDEISPALPTASGSVNTSITEHEDVTAGIKFAETNIYTNSQGYLMFVKNKGYLYNTESLGTIVSVAVTYSSGVSTTAKVGVYFGSSAVTEYTTTSNQTIAGQSKTDTFLNSSNGNGFFQISTSNKNCQITQIVITYTTGSIDSNTTEFSSLSTKASINVGYTTQVENTEGFFLLEDINNLEENDEVIIAASEKLFALGAQVSGKTYMANVACSINDKQLTSSDALVFTVVAGASDGQFAFMNGEKYLAWNSSNSAIMDATLSANSSWEVAIDNEGATTIKNAADSTRLLQYNAGSPRFAAYASSQTAVQIYKKTTGTAETFAVTQASIMFGTLIEEELYTNLTSVANTQFGVIYGVGKSAEELKAAIAEVNAGTKSFEDMKTATGLRSLAPEVAKVNEEGVEDANGKFYQFGVSINNIAESKFDTEVVAAAYVLYEGQYYLASVRLESLSSIVQIYVDTKAEDPMVSSHLGMLQWFVATYPAAK